jgi:hypothetical protein
MTTIALQLIEARRRPPVDVPKAVAEMWTPAVACDAGEGSS